MTSEERQRRPQRRLKDDKSESETDDTSTNMGSESSKKAEVIDLGGMERSDNTRRKLLKIRDEGKRRQRDRERRRKDKVSAHEKDRDYALDIAGSLHSHKVD